MATYTYLSGTIYTVTADSESEAEDLLDALLQSDPCPCGDDDCECVIEGECDTQLVEVN